MTIDQKISWPGVYIRITFQVRLGDYFSRCNLERNMRYDKIFAYVDLIEHNMLVVSLKSIGKIE